jgi:hypothetical protein
MADSETWCENTGYSGSGVSHLPYAPEPMNKVYPNALSLWGALHNKDGSRLIDLFGGVPRLLEYVQGNATNIMTSSMPDVMTTMGRPGENTDWTSITLDALLKSAGYTAEKAYRNAGEVKREIAAGAGLRVKYAVADIVGRVIVNMFDDEQSLGTYLIWVASKAVVWTAVLEFCSNTLTLHNSLDDEEGDISYYNQITMSFSKVAAAGRVVCDLAINHIFEYKTADGRDAEVSFPVYVGQVTITVNVAADDPTVSGIIQGIGYVPGNVEINAVVKKEIGAIVSYTTHVDVEDDRAGNPGKMGDYFNDRMTENGSATVLSEELKRASKDFIDYIEEDNPIDNFFGLALIQCE